MSVRPASIIAFADVFKLHRAYAHTNPMVEDGELVSNGTPRSSEIMGKPQENSISSALANKFPAIPTLTILISDLITHSNVPEGKVRLGVPQMGMIFKFLRANSHFDVPDREW